MLWGRDNIVWCFLFIIMQIWNCGVYKEGISLDNALSNSELYCPLLQKVRMLTGANIDIKWLWLSGAKTAIILASPSYHENMEIRNRPALRKPEIHSQLDQVTCITFPLCWIKFQPFQINEEVNVIQASMIFTCNGQEFHEKYQACQWKIVSTGSMTLHESDRRLSIQSLFSVIWLMWGSQSLLNLPLY